MAGARGLVTPEIFQESPVSMGNIASSAKKSVSAAKNVVLNVGSRLSIWENASATDKNVFPRLRHAFSGGESVRFRSGMRFFSGGNAFFGENMSFSGCNGRHEGCAGHFSPVPADSFAADDCVPTVGWHSEAPTRHLGTATLCIRHGNGG